MVGETVEPDIVDGLQGAVGSHLLKHDVEHPVGRGFVRRGEGLAVKAVEVGLDGPVQHWLFGRRFDSVGDGCGPVGQVLNLSLLPFHNPSRHGKRSPLCLDYAASEPDTLLAEVAGHFKPLLRPVRSPAGDDPCQLSVGPHTASNGTFT